MKSQRKFFYLQPKVRAFTGQRQVHRTTIGAATGLPKNRNQHRVRYGRGFKPRSMRNESDRGLFELRGKLNLCRTLCSRLRLAWDLLLHVRKMLNQAAGYLSNGLSLGIDLEIGGILVKRLSIGKEFRNFFLEG